MFCWAETRWRPSIQEVCLVVGPGDADPAALRGLQRRPCAPGRGDAADGGRGERHPGRGEVGSGPVDGAPPAGDAGLPGLRGPGRDPHLPRGTRPAAAGALALAHRADARGGLPAPSPGGPGSGGVGQPLHPRRGHVPLHRERGVRSGPPCQLAGGHGLPRPSHLGGAVAAGRARVRGAPVGLRRRGPGGPARSGEARRRAGPDPPGRVRRQPRALGARHRRGRRTAALGGRRGHRRRVRLDAECALRPGRPPADRPGPAGRLACLRLGLRA
jgi:hypothetical protein